MKINYNYQKIETTLKNLVSLINTPISFVPIAIQNELNFNKKNFPRFVTPVVSQFCRYIQKNPDIQLKCFECDLKILNSDEFTSHICHSGLYDATFPIVKNDIIVGHLLFGCLRCSKSPKEPYNISDPKAIQLYKERPFFNDEQINSLINLLPDLLFGDAITFEYNHILNEIVDYINNNLYNNLSINGICSLFHISKNTLYMLFKEHFDTTPNNYINTRRLEKAKEVIPQKELPLYLIASNLGFDNYSHFCRIFKKHTGLSPSQFRKSFDNTKKAM